MTRVVAMKIEMQTAKIVPSFVLNNLLQCLGCWDTEVCFLRWQMKDT